MLYRVLLALNIYTLEAQCLRGSINMLTHHNLLNLHAAIHIPTGNNEFHGFLFKILFLLIIICVPNWQKIEEMSCSDNNIFAESDLRLCVSSY